MLDGLGKCNPRQELWGIGHWQSSRHKSCLTYEVEVEEKTEPNATWNKVVKGCSENLRTGGAHNSNGGTWNTILSVEKELDEIGINISTFLKPSEDGSSWVWELESDNIYTVKSMRKLIDGISLPIADKETEWIRWIPNKSNIHLWRVLSDRLPTRENLRKRGVTLASADCPLCNVGTESLDHIMTSCSTTLVIGAHLTNWVDWWPRNVHTVADFWDKIKRTGERSPNNDVRKSIGAAYLSTIWRLRNNKVFKGVVQNDMETVREIQNVAYNWVRCRSKGGKFVKWENWLCNPANAVNLCTVLAPC